MISVGDNRIVGGLFWSAEIHFITKIVQGVLCPCFHFMCWRLIWNSEVFLRRYLMFPCSVEVILAYMEVHCFLAVVVVYFPSALWRRGCRFLQCTVIQGRYRWEHHGSSAPELSSKHRGEFFWSRRILNSPLIDRSVFPRVVGVLIWWRDSHFMISLCRPLF